MPDEKVLGMVMVPTQVPLVNKTDTMVKIILCVVMVVLLKIKCLLSVACCYHCQVLPSSQLN
ncbi:MAG: hypothetical protein Rsou_1680 [Candidatus Ruthia sp. Asou_11_S2]|nr:hypothetical protein [Candidatus Ruthia sp. Asou_11_S2]